MADNAIFDLYNDDGSVYINLATYVGAFYSSFSTNGATSGSFYDAKMVGRDLLYFNPGASALNGTGFGGPVVTSDKNTGIVSWAYQGTAQNTAKNDTIIYGGF